MTGAKKEEASENEKSDIELYKILAHYLINSVLDDDQVAT